MKTKNKKSGVTLIELIIVVVIIMIMVTMVFVLRKPAEKRIGIEHTAATIELLSAAIEQYYDLYHKFPDPNNKTTNEYPSDCNENGMEGLYYKLSLAPDAVKILNRIDTSMIKNDDSPGGSKDNYLEYIDSWGKEFKYEYEKDKGYNFPIITSAGPDKDFNKEEDNITNR